MATGIPKEFQLLGHTIKVRVIPRSKWRHGKGNVGIWMPDKLRIDLLADPIETQLQAVRERIAPRSQSSDVICDSSVIGESP